MLDHISRCSASERELSQHILLQAISSLENISQISSISPIEADGTAKGTKQVIQSLVILNEVLFRKDSSSLQDKEQNEGLPENLSTGRTVNITPPPGYSPNFLQEMVQVGVTGEDIESIDEIDIQEVPRLVHPVPGEQMVDVCIPFVESTSSFPSRKSSQELDSHASSPIWFDVATVIKSVRTLLEIKCESVPGGIPRLFVEQIASWEMIFQVQRPSSTNSIWNIDSQEQRVEVFGPSDLGTCYRLKCVCPTGALHSLDVYCPRHIPSELSDLDAFLRDSKEYNKKKKKKVTSPEQSEDEGDDMDENKDAEAETEEDPEQDHEAIAAREAAERKKELQECKEKEIADIMKMVGWKGVKEHIRKLEAKVKTSEMQGVDLKCEGFGTILTGGSGTGKTTFANQYAAYLHAAGLVSTSTVKSTTGIYLADGGISRIKNYIENMERDGGILFIDDAHFLLSSDHSSGIKVLDYLLQTIPLHSAKIAFILAGTEKGMRKVIGHGGHSTATMFQYLINFEDFKDEELVGIFGRVIKKKWDGKMIVEGGEAGLFVRVATRRVGRGRGMERFGNARAVEALVGRVWERQVVRRAAEREKQSQGSNPAQGNDSPSASSKTDNDTLVDEKKADTESTPGGMSAGTDAEGMKASDEVTTSEKEANVNSSATDSNIVSAASEPVAVNKDVDSLPVGVEFSESEEPLANKYENTEIAKEQSTDTNDETQDTATDADPEDYQFTKEDILGPDPSNAVLNSPAWTQLQKLTGLEKVKDSILSLLELVKANYQREMEEKPLLKVSLNRLFLGPPGTGKTLVAKIYGQLLAEIGILSKGEVLLRNPSDLIGQYIGDSEANTKAALNAAIGNVLVIDEAYMMYSGGSDGTGNESDSYRQGIMDTLVGEIQSTPGEDRCVLLLGYDTAMEEMLQNSNPGLARRFPLADAFRFQNFTAQELESILRSKLADDVLEATDEAIRVAMDVLEKASQRANFGNGGEVENLISKAKTNYQSRASTLPIADRPKEWIFLPQDFDPSFDRQKSAPSNLRKLFADVVGCESVIHKLETYQRVALAMKSRDLDPREYIPTNFVFKGPPGTGKTTTARKLASVYYDMGLLAEPSVVECSASDLIGKYIGHSGPKTAKVFEKALGRVLFIDEAYRLADGGKCSYASEVVSELVDLMTKEKYKGKIVVVLAGYEDEMNGLLGMNPGLASRFPEEICFANLSPETCVEILNIKIRQAGIGLGFLEYVRGANAEVTALMKKFVATKGWGNARDVETLAKGICRGVFASLGAGGELVCTRDVVVGVLRGMLGERMKRGGDCVDEETVWGNSRIRGTDNRKMMMADRRTGQRKLERVKEKLPGEVKKVGELEVFLASGMQ